MPCIFTRINKLMIVLLAGLGGGAGFQLSQGIVSFEISVGFVGAPVPVARR